jgi:hypothetical protein
MITVDLNGTDPEEFRLARVLRVRTAMQCRRISGRYEVDQ